MSHHIINGKKTIHGHTVHYHDHQGTSHAAIIRDIEIKNGVHHADLHVHHRTNGSDNFIENVPHSTTGGGHTWNHIPE